MKKFLKTTLSQTFAAQARVSKQVGFIGLGQMGSGMVRNLHKSGVKVQAFDVVPETRETFRKEGIPVAESIKEMTSNPEIEQIVLMLPAAKHVSGILEGEEGIFQNWKGEIIDCSTIGPQAASELHESGKKHGVKFIDAPVSGGIVAAANGVLTFMVGAENQTQFEDIKTLLQPMAKNVFNCEKPAAGQIAKAANNMALAIQMISVAEALTLGKKLGMDPKTLTNIMNTASSQCWSVTAYNPCPGVLEGLPSERDYEGGFAAQLMLKDLGLSQEAAKSVDTQTPLGALSQKIYQQICDDGLATKDFGIVYKQLLENKI